MDYDAEQNRLDDLAIEDGVSPIWRVLQKANQDIAFVNCLRRMGIDCPETNRILLHASDTRVKCREILLEGK